MLISIIITGIFSLFSFVFGSYKHYMDTWQIKHDVHIALKYIEKRLREFNQVDIVFDSDKNIFRGKNYKNESARVDLSGNISYKMNTMVYFYKSKGEIRFNKNNEHNVLADNIKDVTVNELVEGQLIEIEVIPNKTEYSDKIRLNLSYKKEKI